MHNGTLPLPFLQVLGLQDEALGPQPFHLASCHGQFTTLKEEEPVMLFLLHAGPVFLSLLLTVLHLLSFLLTKLFIFLLEIDDRRSRAQLIAEEYEIKGGGSDDEELFAAREQEEGLFFFYGDSALNDVRQRIVGEGNYYSSDRQLLKADHDDFVTSATESPLDVVDGHDKYGEVLATVNATNSQSIPPSASACVPVDDEDSRKEKKIQQQEAGDCSIRKENEDKLNSVNVDQRLHFDSKKFKLEEHTFGCSLTSESTSKSSMEWRSSTIFRDSETECPFSSSSRRSSTNWETYTLFRKYDEDMMFFDRLSAQKLTETESFRSLKYQPRSISKRIVHKFAAHKKKGGAQDPYQELESAYVAQVCLAWEALNWNYNYLRQTYAKLGTASFCTTWIAQQFQQFQVLLQRFIEDEPYERGRRPEVFARTRIFSPKLLQVPEFQDAGAEEGKGETISSTKFILVLEDAIRTFMDFLKADRQNPCQMLKALMKKKKSSSVDPNHLHFIKKENTKKKMMLKELLRPRSCIGRKRLNGEQEMEVLMGLIDTKIVSRVLRMAEISQEQLHWCEEKMNKLKVTDNGKIQRDSSPLFLPVH